MSQEDIDNIEIMEPDQIVFYNFKVKIYRFVFSSMELILAKSNVTGQQSEIVRFIYSFLVG